MIDCKIRVLALIKTTINKQKQKKSTNNANVEITKKDDEETKSQLKLKCKLFLAFISNLLFVISTKN